MYVCGVREQVLALTLVLGFVVPATAEDPLVSYADAVQAYREQRWEAAAEGLGEWLTRHPEHAQAGTAWLLKAEALVQQRAYGAARQAYLHFADQHPAHAEYRRAVFRAGECAYFYRDFASAERELTDFWERYPEDALNAHVLYYLGDLALHGEDAESAERWYQRSLSRFPQGPLADDSRLGLARSWQAQGKAEQAWQAYQALLESEGRVAARARALLQRGQPSPDTAWQAIWESAEAAYESGDYAAAAEGFQRLTQPEVPQDWVSEGWSGLGWARYQLEDYAAAAEAFDRLQNAFPDSDLAKKAGLVRAQTYELAGREAEALDAFLQVARAGTPDQVPIAWFEAARLQEQQEDPAAALQSLRQLLEQAPDFADVDAALYQKAWLLTELQRTVAAEAVWERLHEEHPTSRFWADATYRLAERALRAERRERAGRLLARLQEQPSLPDDLRSHTWYLQGQWAVAAERWDRVREPLERLRAEFPASPLRLPAEFWIAEAWYQQRQFEHAAAAFERLDGQITDSGECWLAMVPLRQAQILVEQEQWDAAEELADGIATRFPGFRQQYQVDLVIGRCRAARGEQAAARESFEQVVRSPEGGASEAAAEAQWRIGLSYQQEGDDASALRAFELVERLFAHPEWQAAALLHIGQCHQRQGRTAEAERAFQKLQQQHPQTVHAGQAQSPSAVRNVSAEVPAPVQESHRE